ncbi:MAG: 2-oxoacid:acceptor oxidoreductase family protein, partial [Candidatus Diapherotrites archaeon]
LKKDGVVIINTNKSAKDFESKIKGKVVTVDMTKVAMDIIGKPFVNIIALGAFAAITNEIKLESVFKAIDQEFAHKKDVGELNKKAAEELYKRVKGV